MKDKFVNIKNDLWFKENLYDDCSQILKIDENICSIRTPYQDIDIFSNKRFGKVLALDGIIQLTEFDEHIYHEAMAHSPLFLSKAHNKKVCIVGGGDGGVLREVVKHNTVSEITILEIDADVINLCTKYLPEISNGAYNDKRVKVFNMNAIKYLDKVNSNTYDVVIVDSTDPNDFAKDLFSKNFYSSVSRVLNDGGFAIFQSGSILMQPNEYIDGYYKLKNFFEYISLIKIANVTYYGGEFCLILVGKSKDIQQEKIQHTHKLSDIQTKWYSPQKFRASIVNTPMIEDNLI